MTKRFRDLYIEMEKRQKEDHEFIKKKDPEYYERLKEKRRKKIQLDMNNFHNEAIARFDKYLSQAGHSAHFYEVVNRLRDRQIEMERFKKNSNYSMKRKLSAGPVGKPGKRS